MMIKINSKILIVFKQKKNNTIFIGEVEAGVLPETSLVAEVCRRALRNERVLQRLADIGEERNISVIERGKAFHEWNDNAFVIPSIFVLVLARIEEMVIMGMGPRVIKPKTERTQRRQLILSSQSSGKENSPFASYSMKNDMYSEFLLFFMFLREC